MMGVRGLTHHVKYKFSMSGYLLKSCTTICKVLLLFSLTRKKKITQCSKLSPTLFSFYIADMPRPTKPVKRICYADDITVWASGVEISELEHKVNTYLTEMSRRGHTTTREPVSNNKVYIIYNSNKSITGKPHTQLYYRFINRFPIGLDFPLITLPFQGDHWRSVFTTGCPS